MPKKEKKECCSKFKKKGIHCKSCPVNKAIQAKKKKKKDKKKKEKKKREKKEKSK